MFITFKVCPRISRIDTDFFICTNYAFALLQAFFIIGLSRFNGLFVFAVLELFFV